MLKYIAIAFAVTATTFVINSQTASAASFSIPVPTCSIPTAEIERMKLSAKEFEPSSGSFSTYKDTSNPVVSFVIGRHSVSADLLLFINETDSIVQNNYGGGAGDISGYAAGSAYARYNSTTYNRVSEFTNSSLGPGSWSCIEQVYRLSQTNTPEQEFPQGYYYGYTETPPPTPCEYDSNITADDPLCVAPPPPPPPDDTNYLPFAKKTAILISFFFTGLIAYQFRFRGTD